MAPSIAKASKKNTEIFSWTKQKNCLEDTKTEKTLRESEHGCRRRKLRVCVCVLTLKMYCFSHKVHTKLKSEKQSEVETAVLAHKSNERVCVCVLLQSETLERQCPANMALCITGLEV